MNAVLEQRPMDGTRRSFSATYVEVKVVEPLETNSMDLARLAYHGDVTIVGAVVVVGSLVEWQSLLTIKVPSSNPININFNLPDVI